MNTLLIVLVASVVGAPVLALTLLVLYWLCFDDDMSYLGESDRPDEQPDA